jgi:hypothetical protein
VVVGPTPNPYAARDSDVAPVLAGPCALLAGVQAGVAEHFQEKCIGFPQYLISKKNLCRFQGFVQGYIILKKCNTNLKNI